MAALLALLLAACQRPASPAAAPGPEATAEAPAPPPVPVEPLPTSYHEQARAEAEGLVPDPARGGPRLHPAASPLPPFAGVDRAEARYVGAGACAGCHPAEAEIWAGSAHARARQTLADSGRGYDPSCLPCHVTGLMHPGGFTSLKETPQLEHLGCEACHGPGSAHVAASASGGSNDYGELPVGAAACVACHTHDNSPDFRFEAYWPAIAHGRGD